MNQINIFDFCQFPDHEVNVFDCAVDTGQKGGQQEERLNENFGFSAGFYQIYLTFI